MSSATSLRADAQRNLGLILEAARAVFAEEGLEASVADVAERAGVGTATIFRRFPTKDDLVAAILEQELAAIVRRARVAAESDDPGTAIGEFMASAIESFVRERCFCEAGGTDLFDRPRLQELVGEVTASVALLLARAQEAGAIRPDVVAEDIGFLISAVGQAGLRLERTSPGAWRRYLDIQLDGLRAEGARPLTRKPPTPQQLHDAKRRAAAPRRRKTA
ncbi:MAG TPA: TetR family transcriptional regulator [Gaiellaceae bacterium]|nr:TetR family transcriptional regulator [Gaiellaceae bacterium]